MNISGCVPTGNAASMGALPNREWYPPLPKVIICHFVLLASLLHNLEPTYSPGENMVLALMHMYVKLSNITKDMLFGYLHLYFEKVFGVNKQSRAKIEKRMSSILADTEDKGPTDEANAYWSEVFDQDSDNVICISSKTTSKLDHVRMSYSTNTADRRYYAYSISAKSECAYAILSTMLTCSFPARTCGWTI